MFVLPDVFFAGVDVWERGADAADKRDARGSDTFGGTEDGAGVACLRAIVGGVV